MCKQIGNGCGTIFIWNNAFLKSADDKCMHHFRLIMSLTIMNQTKRNETKWDQVEANQVTSDKVFVFNFFFALFFMLLRKDRRKTGKVARGDQIQ